MAVRPVSGVQTLQQYNTHRATPLYPRGIGSLASSNLTDTLIRASRVGIYTCNILLPMEVYQLPAAHHQSDMLCQQQEPKQHMPTRWQIQHLSAQAYRWKQPANLNVAAHADGLAQRCNTHQACPISTVAYCVHTPNGTLVDWHAASMPCIHNNIHATMKAGVLASFMEVNRHHAYRTLT